MNKWEWIGLGIIAYAIVIILVMSIMTAAGKADERAGIK